MNKCELPPANIEDPVILSRYLRKLAACLGNLESTSDADLADIYDQLALLSKQLEELRLEQEQDESDDFDKQEVFQQVTDPSTTHPAINMQPTVIDGQNVFTMKAYLL